LMSLWIIPCSWLARVVTPSLRVLETTTGSGGLASLEFRIILGAFGMLEQRTLAREGWPTLLLLTGLILP
jgi:hypothetical protein